MLSAQCFSSVGPLRVPVAALVGKQCFALLKAKIDQWNQRSSNLTRFTVFSVMTSRKLKEPKRWRQNRRRRNALLNQQSSFHTAAWSTVDHSSRAVHVNTSNTLGRMAKIGRVDFIGAAGCICKRNQRRSECRLWYLKSEALKQSSDIQRKRFQRYPVNLHNPQNLCFRTSMSNFRKST